MLPVCVLVCEMLSSADKHPEKPYFRGHGRYNPRFERREMPVMTKVRDTVDLPHLWDFDSMLLKHVNLKGGFANTQQSCGMHEMVIFRLAHMLGDDTLQTIDRGIRRTTRLASVEHRGLALATATAILIVPRGASFQPRHYGRTLTATTSRSSGRPIERTDLHPFSRSARPVLPAGHVGAPPEPVRTLKPTRHRPPPPTPVLHVSTLFRVCPESALTLTA